MLMQAGQLLQTLRRDAHEASKGQLRSFDRSGGASSVFSAELVDEQVC